MTEKELYALITATVKDALTAANLTTVKVRQADQPRIVGTPTNPVLLFSNQPAHRFGFLKREDTWDGVADTMTHTETQPYETTFQAGALWPQDPADLTGMTAGDLLNFVAGVLQSDATRSRFLTAGVGIYRIEDIRTPYFKDDRDQFEASPSFDFTLTHNQTTVSTVPLTNQVTGELVAT